MSSVSILSPKKSGEFIVANAKYVKVLEEGIENLVQEVVKGLKNNKINVENFSQHELHPNSKDANAVDWIFLVDTLNFCFWTPGNDVKWQINGYTGYFGLCAGIKRALKEGMDITNPEFYGKITVEELDNIFRSDNGENERTHIPLIEERVACLHEASRKLLQKYNGSFKNCIKICNKSAKELLKLIVTEFSSFRDEAVFEGQPVALYKRAQILIGDLWSCFRGETFGEFHDLEEITMFADYRVPQVLVHFKSLQYSPELWDFLKKNEILENGDQREVEIRGASIYIVERVLEKIQNEKKYPEISSRNVNSIILDHFLWDYRRQYAKELEAIPFHKVLSIYY